MEREEKEGEGPAGVDDRRRRRATKNVEKNSKCQKLENLTLASTSSAILVFSAAGTSWRRMRSHDAVISC